MKGIAIFVALMAAILGGVWAIDVAQDRSIHVVVVTSVPMYSLPPQDYPKVNPKVGTLAPGQSVKVKRMSYGKDFQTFRVETESGETGWVLRHEGIEILDGRKHS